MKTKLIRDKLGPKEGRVMYQVDKETHIALLVAKLHEEAQEIAEDCTDVYEYADLLTVLESLASVCGVGWDKVLEAKFEKAKEKGAFLSGKVMHVP